MGFPDWDSRYFHLRCSLVYSGAPHIQGPPSTKKVAKGPNFYPVANKIGIFFISRYWHLNVTHLFTIAC